MQYNWHAQWAPNTQSFYAKRITPNRQIVSMANEVLLRDRSILVDHVNRKTLDNRRANLREATNSQNSANRKQPRTNTSGYVGIYWKPKCNKWQAMIGQEINGERSTVSLGYFTTKEAAARAYNAAAKKLHGEFANLNHL